MKRQALPEKLMPEWEELCAVAMAVQNMHLMATSMGDVAAFWSSHTWCKDARDSKGEGNQDKREKENCFFWRKGNGLEKKRFNDTWTNQ